MSRDGTDGKNAESWTVPDSREAPPSPASAPLFQPGVVMAERYELRRILGRGGMGVVYEAYDRVLDQAIAIKIVRSEYAGDRTWAERLAREVKLARQINHPNVCRVFDFGVAEAHPFLTMELAAGGTLREEIASGRTTERSFEERLTDARAIASGLAAIHAAGIIHRDVAPQNVLRTADGRLVLSDFGLATDRFDGTSSVHGGTITYMAPEVARGARAAVASDVWSLGVVIHELVFGVRCAWSPTGALVEPRLGRSLTELERGVLAACRACTRPSRARRPMSALAVEPLLRRRSRTWPPPSTQMHAALGLLILAAVIALGTAARNHRRSIQAAVAPGAIAPEGTAVDWSARARILASVPEKIQCIVLLPDRKTVRFVWGVPRHAEDVDTETGARHPSRLVPAAYTEGCPDVSRDNSKIVFAGHREDNQPAAFVSFHPDGRDAVPVVQAGEPSMDSDPAWLPDGDSFLYTVDIAHAAIYSLKSQSSTALPAGPEEAFTTGYAVLGNSIIVKSNFPGDATDLRRLRFPGLIEDLHLRLSTYVLDQATSDDRHYFMGLILSGSGYQGSPFGILDSTQRRLRRSGAISMRHVRHPVMTAGGMAFVASSQVTVLSVADDTGKSREVEMPPEVMTASACGDGLIAQVRVLRTTTIARLDWSGNLIERLNFGRSPRVPSCSPNGRVVYYYEWSTPALMRCDGGICRELYRGKFNGFRLSPDGQRIVTLAVADRSFTVRSLPASGDGPVHDLAQTEVACAPQWSSSPGRIWFSTRRGAQLVWTEVWADSGRPTGATSPGAWDCMDGAADPQSPVKEKARVVWKRRSEVRFITSADLGVQ